MSAQLDKHKGKGVRHLASANAAGLPARAGKHLPSRKAAPSGASKFTLGKELSGIRAHDMVTAGMSVDTARGLMDAYRLIGSDDVLRVLGISERTLQRASIADKPLDSNASDRALRLATVTSQAIDVLGSQDAAERWLSSPAIGLDRRRPIDLLQSSEGTELVKTLLTRMDYGVYA